MATIQTSTALIFSGSTDSFQASASSSVTQSGTGALFQTQSIGTSSEALNLGDLANVGGGLLIKNTDETNYVEIDAVNTFNSFPQKILAGRTILLAPQTTTIYAKANTASVAITIAAAVT
jgi:hypothetical protein